MESAEAGRLSPIESLDPLPQGDCVQVRGVIVGREHHEKFIGSRESGMNPPPRQCRVAARQGPLRLAQGVRTPTLSNEIIATIARQDRHENALYRATVTMWRCPHAAAQSRR